MRLGRKGVGECLGGEKLRNVFVRNREYTVDCFRMSKLVNQGDDRFRRIEE